MEKKSLLRKRISAVTAAILTAALFSGCRTDNVSETAGLSEVTNEKPEETAFEESEPVQFYFQVTDYTGEDKLIYYMNNAPDGEPFAYFSEVCDNPEDYYGLVPVVSEDEPVRESEFSGFGELADYMKESMFYDTVVSYYTYGSTGSVYSSYFENDQHPDKYNDIITLIGSFEPEYIDTDSLYEEHRERLISEAMKKDSELTQEEAQLQAMDIISAADFDPVKESEDFNEYDRMYPVSSLRFGNGYRFGSQLYFSFCTFDGRLAAKVQISDFSDMAELVYNNGKSPTPEQLREAYQKSCYSESDWFYADNTPLYNYITEYVITSEGNRLENVDPNVPDEIYFLDYSSEFVECFDLGDLSAEGYQTAVLGSLSIQLPEYFENIMSIPTQTRWKSGAEAPDGMEAEFILKKDTGDGTGEFKDFDIESLDYVRGSFNGDRAVYRSTYDPNACEYEDSFSFTADGDSYTAVCRLKSDKRSDEYDRVVKNVLGSITAAVSDSSESAESEPNAALRLNTEPSPFTEEGSSLAAGYSLDGYRYYKAMSPITLTCSFYATDLDKSYNTDYRWYLEKLEDDGLWYAVKPNAAIIFQNDLVRTFGNALGKDREYIIADLSCYPLLPEGKYRIAKPFFEKGSGDTEQYAAFYEFEMTNQAYFGENEKIYAECESGEYSSSADSISYSLYFPHEADCYMVGNIADIEQLSQDGWHSVRKKAYAEAVFKSEYAYVSSNASDRFTLDTADYDISQKGDYRIRISVGNDNFPRNNTTVYAYFKIV